MDVIYEILSFFSKFTPKLTIFGLLFFIWFPRRKLFFIRFPLSVAVFCGLSYVLPKYMSLLTVGWFSFNFLIYFVLSMLMWFFCFNVTWRQVIFFSTVAYTMEHCVSNTYRAIIGYFPFSSASIAGKLLYIGVIAAMGVAFYFMFARHVKNGVETGMKSNWTIILSIVALAVIYVLSMWTVRVTAYDRQHQIYAALCSLFLLIIQFGVFSREEAEQRIQLFEHIIAIEREQHRMSEENIELINIKCHDLKRKITEIGENAGELSENTLKEMSDAIKIYEATVRTGNETLDTLLMEKRLLCERYGIKLSIIAQGELLDFISRDDLYFLFGNALDNAVESAKNVEDITKRTITFNVRGQGDVVFVHIENYCGEELVFVNGLPQTTKEDKRFHGYGVKSISYIVKKYGGELKIFVKNSMFNLDILFTDKHNKK